MDNLKQEISKNIQLVFDNEASFINEFLKDVNGAAVLNIYLGIDNHVICYREEGYLTRLSKKIGVSFF